MNNRLKFYGHWKQGGREVGRDERYREGRREGERRGGEEQGGEKREEHSSYQKIS